MKPMLYYITLFLFLTLFQSCGTEAEPPEPPQPEPYFKPGEYGGQELPGTEHLTWISPSPSGNKIALIRERTPSYCVWQRAGFLSGGGCREIFVVCIKECG